MLRLPAVRYLRPTSLGAALDQLASAAGPASQQTGAAPVRVLAGGTDLLPNLKLGSDRAEALLSLAALPALRGVELLPGASGGAGGATLRIGAATTLATLGADPLVQRHLPSLAATVARIASPQIRNQATLAGNLLLDTRCRYINQSELFRAALGGCLKSHGDVCHVVPGGKGCVAALSCDSAPILIALGATLVVHRAAGVRRVEVAKLYNTNGLAHTAIEPGELVVAVEIPIAPSHVRVTYRKWARRQSIDFPLVSVALRLEVAETTATLKTGLLVVGALGPRPRLVSLAKLAGQPLAPALAEAVAALAVKRCRTLPNLPYDAAYRRRRLGVEAKRAALALLG